MDYLLEEYQDVSWRKWDVTKQEWRFGAVWITFRGELPAGSYLCSKVQDAEQDEVRWVVGIQEDRPHVDQSTTIIHL